jgi:hypothetical protein
MKDMETVSKNIGKSIAATAVGYLGTRWVSNMIGDKVKEENKALTEFGVSAGVTIAGAYMYMGMGEQYKSLATGAIVGAGVSTSIKFLGLDFMKKNIPESMKSVLAGIEDLGGDERSSTKYMTYKEYEDHVNEEVARRVKNDVNAVLEATRKHQLGAEYDQLGEEGYEIDGDELTITPDVYQELQILAERERQAQLPQPQVNRSSYDQLSGQVSYEDLNGDYDQLGAEFEEFDGDYDQLGAEYEDLAGEDDYLYGEDDLEGEAIYEDLSGEDDLEGEYAESY